VKGRIKKLNKQKGYGFIRADNGQEIFFHKAELAAGIVFNALETGEELMFFIEEGKKGKKATTIIKT